ncbi:hypothetical protein ARC23_14075 [Stenotrophomonas beteli]|jgi:hypothetical protein|uniref:Uncharacterized protein n=2 Tax=Stenotrophomonas beteli TaxID=3384461 RepID=A0A0R0AX74_9GAMM|nr:hypothetical protein ARC23_14075 [Stenotrophomonas maltophilia]
MKNMKKTIFLLPLVAALSWECVAAAPLDAHASGTRPGDASIDLPQPSCAKQPLATYLFALVGKGLSAPDGCGRSNAVVTQAFDTLLAEVPAKQAPSLKARLLTGPSAAGKPLSIEGRTWWLYSACQAHACGSTQLAALYDPADRHMVGRLILNCEVRWLGNPSDAQRAVLDARKPVNLEMVRRLGDCGGEP